MSDQIPKTQKRRAEKLERQRKEEATPKPMRIREGGSRKVGPKKGATAKEPTADDGGKTD